MKVTDDGIDQRMSEAGAVLAEYIERLVIVAELEVRGADRKEWRFEGPRQLALLTADFRFLEALVGLVPSESTSENAVVRDIRTIRGVLAGVGAVGLIATAVLKGGLQAWEMDMEQVTFRLSWQVSESAEPQG